MKHNRKIKQSIAGIVTAASILGSIPVPAYGEVPEAAGQEEETLLQEQPVSEPENAPESPEAERESEEREQNSSGEEKEEDSASETDGGQAEEAEQPAEDAQEQQLEEDSTETQEAMEAGTVSAAVEDADPDAGTFTVRVKNVSLKAGEKLVIPVWQDSKQKDIVWNTASLEGSDYLVKESAAAHGYRTGTYHIHVYKQSSSGAMTFLADTALQIRPEAENMTAQYGTDLSEAVLGGVKTQGMVSSVKVAVWSEKNGQDDITWEEARKQADGSWKAEIPMNRHKDTGAYYLHAYAFTRTGQAVLLKTAGFTAEAQKETELKVENYRAEASGTDFTVKADRITAPFPVKEVKIAVWSRSDQSDIVWYRAEKEGEGYSISSSISRHKSYRGKYHAHLYLLGTDGKMTFGGADTFTVEEAKEASLTAEKEEGKDRVRVRLSDYQKPSDILTIEVAVWSEEKGQDDLKWYPAEKEGADWTVSLPASNHSTSGLCQVHAYAFTADYRPVMIGHTTFRNTAVSAAASRVDISDIDQQKGTFMIEVSPGSAEDIDHIETAVWSTSNQSNIKWYRMERDAAGSWKTVMDSRNHGYLSGTYYVHAYAVLKNGSMKFLAASEAKLNGENRVVTEKLSGDSVKITIYNPMRNGKKASSVLFPTWSKEKGQDDIVWYSGQRQADGSFQAVVRQAKHSHAGGYITHVYVSDGAGQSMVQSLEYTLTAASGSGREMDAEARAVMRNIIYAVETGGQRYGGHRYDCFTEAYTNSSAETAITIGAGAWFAGEAKRLLTLIRNQYPEVFEKYDTAGIGRDLDRENWKYYGTNGSGTRTILKNSAKASAIQKIISTPEGIAVQDALIDEQMVRYADQAKALGVTDLKARLFCANIQHLGGYNAMVRIVNYCKNDGDALTMENLWSNMREREAGRGNYVGSDLYASRHRKVMEWLNAYL